MEFVYVPLSGASELHRAHERDTQPPQLIKTGNLFLARSDNVLAMRPDFDEVSEEMLSWVAACGSTPTAPDFLNSAHGVYGSDQVLFFSAITPFESTSGSTSPTYGVYTDGNTVSGASGSSVITGSGTSWLQNVWRGCLIVTSAGVCEIYTVSEVDSNIQITIDETLGQTLSGDDYYIIRTYNVNNTDYKLNVQPYTSSIIVSSPSISDPVENRDICGPFYIAITPESGVYSWTKVDTPLASAFGSVWGRCAATDDSGERVVMLQSAISFTGAPQIVMIADITSEDPTSAANWVVNDDGGTNSINTVYGANGTVGAIDYDSTGNTFWVAGKNSSNVCKAATSADGDSWSAAANDIVTDANWRQFGLAHDGNLMMVVGTGEDDSAARAVYYTSDDGATAWSFFTAASLGEGETLYDIVTWDTNKFCICGDNGKILTTIDGGTNWLSQTSGVSDPLLSVGYDGSGRLVAAGSYGTIVYADTSDLTSWTDASLGTNLNIITVMYDGTGYWWAFAVSHADGEARILYSSDGSSWSQYYDISWKYMFGGWANGDYVIGRSFNDSAAGTHTDDIVVGERSGASETRTLAPMEPLSDTYRALTFSVLDGYVALFNTSEWDSTTSKWVHYPRRVRWTAPASYSDFSSSGSGTADISGAGAILDSRPVNGRIVTFETAQIGALIPRGYVADPWEYEVLSENLRLISNPVVVGDNCFFIASDGLLYGTNGISVSRLDGPFDLTKYNDFDRTKPVWLTYSTEINALRIFSTTNAAGDTLTKEYFVQLPTGNVTNSVLPSPEDAGGAEAPAAIVSIEASSDTRDFSAHSPFTSGGKLITGEYSSGSPITGVDTCSSDETTTNRFFSEIETGEIQGLHKEGQKINLRHVILHTYTENTDGTNSDLPYATVEIQSREDSAWHSAGTDDSISCTTTVATGIKSSTIYNGATPDYRGTHFMATDTNGADYTTGTCVLLNSDSSQVADNLPWKTSQASFYFYDTVAKTFTATTAFTENSDYKITLTSALAANNDLWAFSNNTPKLDVDVDDFVYDSTTGMHRFTAVTKHNKGAIDPTVGASKITDMTHLPGEQLPDGFGDTAFGINKLVELPKFRIRIVPKYNGTAATMPDVIKISGVTLVYNIAGEKKIE